MRDQNGKANEHDSTSNDSSSSESRVNKSHESTRESKRLRSRKKDSSNSNNQSKNSENLEMSNNEIKLISAKESENSNLSIEDFTCLKEYTLDNSKKEKKINLSDYKPKFMRTNDDMLLNAASSVSSTTVDSSKLTAAYSSLDSSRDENRYQLRNGLPKTTNVKKEPEIIELTDSSDEEKLSSHTKKKSPNSLRTPHSTTCSVNLNVEIKPPAAKKSKDETYEFSVKNEFCKVNNKKREMKSLAQVDVRASSDNKNVYTYKPWSIKKNDTESLDKILNSDSRSTVYENGKFEMKSKLNKLVGFLNEKESMLAFDDAEGIRVTLTALSNGEEYQITVTLGTDDILYCAAMFHDPVFILAIHMNDITSELYIKEFMSTGLKKDDSTENVFSKTCLISFIEIEKSNIGDTCRNLYSYFNKLNKSTEIPYRLQFLKKDKSIKLFSTLFRDDKSGEISKVFKAFNFSRTVIKYPFNEQSEQTDLSENDLDCLIEGEFLNDNIISFYLKYLQNEVLSKEQNERTHFFNTFFYQCLTQNNSSRAKDSDLKMNAAERRYQKVKNWTRNVDIFSKDYLIIPINKNSHWYLVIICYPYLEGPVYDESTETSQHEEALVVDLDLHRENSIEMCVQNFYKKKPKETTNSTTEKSSSKTKVFPASASNTQIINCNLLDSADEADTEDSIDKFSNANASDREEDDGRVCIKRPVILILDSLPSSRKKRVQNTLREYLSCEWKNKKSQTKLSKEYDSNFENMIHMKGELVNVPSQTNFYDCGIYLLQYVESFFKNPIVKYNFPIDMNNWFDISIIQAKREYIRYIIDELEKDYKKYETSKTQADSLEDKNKLEISNTKFSENLKETDENIEQILVQTRNQSESAIKHKPSTKLEVNYLVTKKIKTSNDEINANCKDSSTNKKSPCDNQLKKFKTAVSDDEMDFLMDENERSIKLLLQSDKMETNAKRSQINNSDEENMRNISSLNSQSVSNRENTLAQLSPLTTPKLITSVRDIYGDQHRDCNKKYSKNQVNDSSKTKRIIKDVDEIF